MSRKRSKEKTTEFSQIMYVNQTVTGSLMLKYVLILTLAFKYLAKHNFD